MQYKANAFEGRNLVYFFLIAFGWTWLWWWILFFSGWVTVPADLGSRDADFGAGVGFVVILLVVLSPFPEKIKPVKQVF